MEYHELEKLTVAKLREKAHEFPDVTGASGLHKDQLLDLLCEKLGIHKPHKVAVVPQKTVIKAQIHALKKERDAAIEAKDAKKLHDVRHKLHRMRRELHQATRITE
jgi:cell division protein FtsX